MVLTAGIIDNITVVVDNTSLLDGTLVNVISESDVKVELIIAVLAALLNVMDLMSVTILVVVADVRVLLATIDDSPLLDVALVIATVL